MRLHRLEITAFGPYTDTVRVDFDALCDHGLFLLHGVTGAGKTSLLDAVCYALYGQVPGRRSAASLRSDLAPADAEPEVVLEFTVGSRRLEVRRCPAWERPKRRGTGTTSQQACVRVRELVNGQWQVRATRLDEAGLLLTDVVGMNLDQFTKVVLLPQGEFAAFLHAPADQRRDLLQRLFGTERFEAVERILAERRRELARASVAAHAERDGLVARVAERALSVRDLIDELPDTEPDAATVTALVEQARGPARVRQQEADAAVDEARRTVTAVEQEAEAFKAWSAAVAEQARLDAEAERVAEQSARLETAGRAAAAAGPLEVLRRDEQELAEAQRDQASALESVRPLLAAQTLPGLEAETTPTEAELAEAAADRRGRLGHLEHLLVVEQSLNTWKREQKATETARAELEVELGRQDRTRSGLLERQDASRRVHDTATPLAAALPAAERDLDRACAVRAAAVERDAAVADLTAAEDTARAAVDRAQQARGVAQELTRRRLEGMAAELAAGLNPGQACPVCGGVEHPAPAVPTADAVSPQDEEAAVAAADTAGRQATEATEQVTTRRERVSALTEASGGLTVAEADEAFTSAQAAHRSAQEAQRSRQEAEAALTAVLAELPQVEATRNRLTTRIQEYATRLTELETRIRDAQRSLDDVIGDEGTVWARHERLSREAKLLESARDSVSRSQRAAGAVKRARAVAVKACRMAGFADVAAARAATVSEAEIATLTAATLAHRDALLAVRTRLAEFDATAWVEAGTTDAHLAERVHASRAALQTAVAQQQQAATAVDRLDRALQAAQELTAELTAWQARHAPLQREFEVVKEVSQCAEGQGSNALRLRLSAFALEARLEQVVQAASLRLARMSGNRYTLVHRQTARKGGGRGGLGIAVLDGWTGREREPGSLSGGETFLASLSLALGLADVVQAEAGGSHIETLFVDEGFGSLDDESLDLVMDILDGLREGGRAVGVVSHVPELRTRIPARLEVVRHPTGSTLRVA